MESRDIFDEVLNRNTQTELPLKGIKSEPLEDEARGNIGIIPNWYEPAITIKTELVEDDSAEVILPDWSTPETDTEAAEGKFQVSTEPIGENFNRKTIGGSQVCSEVETKLKTSMEIEDFSIKVEPGEDLPVLIDVKENKGEDEKDKEMGRRVAEEVANIQDFETGALMSSEQYYGKSKKVQREFHCQINSSNTIMRKIVHAELPGQEQPQEQYFQTFYMSDKPHLCQHCGQSFGVISNMRRHVRTVHLNEKRFECQQCGHRFGQSSHLQKHIQTVHQSEKRFVCHYCEEKFEKSGQCRKHIQAVHETEKLFECRYCGRWFGESCNMQRHVRTVHLNEKRFECQHCGQRFGHSSHMQTHIQAAHLIDRKI